MSQIGLTTTVPIEVLLAAGKEAVDLNNIFITDEHYEKYIEYAERDGFPKSMCAWIKGIYGACILGGIKEVVGVVGGDCSNTKSLTEVFWERGIKVHEFSYPVSHQLKLVKSEIMSFMAYFGVTPEQVEQERKRIQPMRDLCVELDRLSYETNQVSGFENHLYQLCMSDFNGDPTRYQAELEVFVTAAAQRKPMEQELRIGYLGVPPMVGDLYDFTEQMNARIVYNEVQREFAFPRGGQAKDIYQQYFDYTYPYNMSYRLKEIEKQTELRKLDGIIHYTQAFCHRAIDHIILKSGLHIPMLHIEGDKLNHLDARTKLRLEAFLDMLLDRKRIMGEGRL